MHKVSCEFPSRVSGWCIWRSLWVGYREMFCVLFLDYFLNWVFFVQHVSVSVSSHYQQQQFIRGWWGGNWWWGWRGAPTAAGGAFLRKDQQSSTFLQPPTGVETLLICFLCQNCFEMQSMYVLVNLKTHWQSQHFTWFFFIAAETKDILV